MANQLSNNNIMNQYGTEKPTNRLRLEMTKRLSEGTQSKSNCVGSSTNTNSKSITVQTSLSVSSSSDDCSQVTDELDKDILSSDDSDLDVKQRTKNETKMKEKISPKAKKGATRAINDNYSKLSDSSDDASLTSEASESNSDENAAIKRGKPIKDHSVIDGESGSSEKSSEDSQASPDSDEGSYSSEESDDSNKLKDTSTATQNIKAAISIGNKVNVKAPLKVRVEKNADKARYRIQESKHLPESTEESDSDDDSHTYSCVDFQASKAPESVTKSGCKSNTDFQKGRPEDDSQTTDDSDCDDSQSKQIRGNRKCSPRPNLGKPITKSTISSESSPASDSDSESSDELEVPDAKFNKKGNVSRESTGKGLKSKIAIEKPITISKQQRKNQNGNVGKKFKQTFAQNNKHFKKSEPNENSSDDDTLSIDEFIKSFPSKSKIIPENTGTSKLSDKNSSNDKQVKNSDSSEDSEKAFHHNSQQFRDSSDKKESIQSGGKARARKGKSCPSPGVAHARKDSTSSSTDSDAFDASTFCRSSSIQPQVGKKNRKENGGVQAPIGPPAPPPPPPPPPPTTTPPLQPATNFGNGEKHSIDEEEIKTKNSARKISVKPDFREELNNAIKNPKLRKRGTASDNKENEPVVSVAIDVPDRHLKDAKSTTKDAVAKIVGSNLTQKDEEYIDLHVKLMKEILTAGNTLRPTGTQKRRKPPLPTKPDLTSILNDVMLVRNKAVQDSESDDSAIDYDEWDDNEESTPDQEIQVAEG